jgi:hypothetical protein
MNSAMRWPTGPNEVRMFSILANTAETESTCWPRPVNTAGGLTAILVFFMTVLLMMQA